MTESPRALLDECTSAPGCRSLLHLVACPELTAGLRDLALANLPVPYHPTVSPAERESLVMAVLSLHRRALNCRACTGCDWEPEHPGGTSNAEATRRRHADFNTHLAHLVVTELA